MKTIHFILKFLLVSVAIGLITLSFFIGNSLFIGIGLWIAAIDLLSTTLLNKPIIEKGPIAKFLYGDN